MPGACPVRLIDVLRLNRIKIITNSKKIYLLYKYPIIFSLSINVIRIKKSIDLFKNNIIVVTIKQPMSFQREIDAKLKKVTTA